MVLPTNSPHAKSPVERERLRARLQEILSDHASRRQSGYLRGYQDRKNGQRPTLTPSLPGWHDDVTFSQGYLAGYRAAMKIPA